MCLFLIQHCCYACFYFQNTKWPLLSEAASATC